MIFEHRRLEVNGIGLALHEGGGGDAVIFLHGFPESRLSWLTPMSVLANDHRVIAPDGRGFGQSDILPDPNDYRIERLVADVLAVADALGARRFTLVGHDWGGVVAWVAAARHPEQIRSLVIVNAPHPTLFQARLDDDPMQRQASSYIARLTNGPSPSPEALWQAIFGETEARGLMSPVERAYLQSAWRRPGAIEAMRHWYRAAPFDFSAVGGRGAGRLPEPLRIDVPTLVVWGMDDTVLRSSLLIGLDTLVPDLELEQVAGAGHAILRERPHLVAARIASYLDARSK